jgi:hypothetical protein
MSEASAKPSPGWQGTVEVDGPERAIRRGKPTLRNGKPYLSGTLWALDGDGVHVGRLTFTVYEEDHMVLLGNAGLDDAEGVDGTDDRKQGGGRALMDKLDALYPPPNWWLAAEEHQLHTPEGLILMRSRRKPGRQWVHTENCPWRKPQDCQCDFPDRPSEHADADRERGN